jgi:hypothetical protein
MATLDPAVSDGFFAMAGGMRHNIGLSSPA